MFNRFFIISLFFISTSALASDDWEYKVVFLPGTVSGANIVKQSHGGYLDPTKTKILNELAAKGWELVSVTGQSGSDHAAYLRRKK